MKYLNDFKNALSTRLKKGEIECTFCEETKRKEDIFIFSKVITPINIEQYISNYTPLVIKRKNRNIELLKISNFELIDNRFLLFSKVNSIEMICFDTNNVNSANEWDIVNYSNNYLITKTIESYLTNKVWAFIDREREFWKQEQYY
jgi:hypothetical protein